MNSANAVQTTRSRSQREIVDFHKNDPSFFPKKIHARPTLKTKFSDAAHWDELAEKHLPRYNLSAWNVPADTGALKTWLDRLDLPEIAFLKMGAYRSLQDAIDSNPAWPLRALIGLMLELREELET